MAIRIAELLDTEPQPWWPHIRQAGVAEVFGSLVLGEQGLRWLYLTPGGTKEPWEITRRRVPPRGERGWDVAGLRRLADLYAKFGFKLVGMEDTPPLDLVRLGRPGGDEQLEWFQDYLRALGEVGVRTLCYNWLAVGTWARTAVDLPERGGALVSGFQQAAADAQPKLLEAGETSHEQLWENLRHFLEAVVPVAREAGVNLALHPDDPPLPEVRGIPRILGTLEAFDRLLRIEPRRENGITLCQGNFALMTDDVPAAIRRYRDRIHFVHLRDVRGSAGDFRETFHDNGPTDLLECLRAYREIGYEGHLRPDHVPTFAGESNARPGYAALGRLHAIGYITGLSEAVNGKAAVAR
jgi:mannonate dehydratase